MAVPVDVPDNLPALSAAELTALLKQRADSLGGLVLPSDLELHRELVRRARRAERLAATLRKLLDQVEAFSFSPPDYVTPDKVIYGFSVTEARRREIWAAAGAAREVLGEKGTTDLPAARPRG